MTGGNRVGGEWRTAWTEVDGRIAQRFPNANELTNQWRSTINGADPLAATDRITQLASYLHTLLPHVPTVYTDALSSDWQTEIQNLLEIQIAKCWPGGF